jgi:calcineurin-like phosphoesterase family protein
MHFSHPAQLYFHPERRDMSGISLDELQNLPKDEIIRRHDEWLIGLWNGIVKKNDFVYHLGDFCLGNRERTEKILQKLNGKKYFIRGNHDKSLAGNERYLEGLWDIKEVKFSHDQFPFIRESETFCTELCHFPMMAWNRRTHGASHIHGHCHGSADNMNKESLELRVDVGLDGNLANYGFVELETVYRHFYDIVNAAGCDNFQEYAEWLMKKQGFRM